MPLNLPFLAVDTVGILEGCPIPLSFLPWPPRRGKIVTVLLSLIQQIKTVSKGLSTTRLRKDICERCMGSKQQNNGGIRMALPAPTASHL